MHPSYLAAITMLALVACTSTTRLAPVDQSASTESTEPEAIDTRSAPPADEPEGSEAADFRTKCMHGDGGACVDLALAYDGGKGVPGDKRRAAFFYAKSCELGHSMGCSGLGSFYLFGEGGVPKDEKRAAELFEKSCSGSSEKAGAIGCFFLGMSLLDGHGVQKDPARAVEVLKKGCKGGVGDACFELGKMSEAKKDWQQAGSYFARACDRLKVEGCGRMGKLFLDGRDVGNPNMGVVRRLLKLGCDKGDKLSCEALQKIGPHGGSPSTPVNCEPCSFECSEESDKVRGSDPARAKALAERACGEDCSPGTPLLIWCHNQGLLLEQRVVPHFAE